MIICDDRSRDEICKVMAKIEDPRIRYIRHSQNVGKSNNMRSGYEATTGKYFVKFDDDDDRLMPEFLAKTSPVLEENPSADLVGTDHWVMDGNYSALKK